MTDIEYLENLLASLIVEREEDFRLYKEMIQNSPLQERKALGYSWYPIEVVKTGYALGDRAYVIVERKSELFQPHQFRSGMSVSLFMENDGKPKEKTGIINFIDKNRMKIILNSRDFPDWVNENKLGVDSLFDDRSYREMESAMNQVIKAHSNRLAELRRVLSLKQVPYFSESKASIVSTLNDSQNEALQSIVSALDVAIVHGPPGTGKTTTLVQAIKQLVERERSVLVCAPSNTAVDLLTERLAAQQLNVIRIGNISRIDDSIVRHTLEYNISHHPESKNIKKIKIKAAEARRKSRKFSSGRSPRERELRQQYKQEASELSAWANDLEGRIVDQIILGADVITCTLVGAAHPVLEKYKFRTAVIDESAQALEPATWIPILKAHKVVLAGDPFQLPPTVKSMEARKMGLSITLVEHLIARSGIASLLTTQYRMHEKIMGFSNLMFYEGRLKAAESVAQHRLALDDGAPILFIDTAGCSFDEETIENVGRNPSRRNRDEAHILREHLYQLLNTYHESNTEPPSIAIISPYREQVTYLESMINDENQLKTMDITVNTIDGFQGQERDVVYISLVRSNTKGDIGFLSDTRRMNVAMTRARKKLIVIGDSVTVGNNAFYNSFLNYCEENGDYHTAWQYMS
jgi:superfamily I DNA and/or RNA helicase